MGALLVALMAVSGPTGSRGSPPGELRGSNPRDMAMLACGYCAGGALFLSVTSSWIEFLAMPTSWGKMAGCVGACYETFF